jgi:hypothetical protein
MKRKKGYRPGYDGGLLYPEYVVAKTDEIVREAELRSAGSQAAAQEQASIAEARANAAVAATDHRP